MKKKIISFILAVIMVIGLIPVNIFADELEELPLLQEEVEEVAEELPEEVTEKLPEEATEELPEEAAEELPEEVAEELSEETVEELSEEKTEEVYEELEMPVFFAGSAVSEEKTYTVTVNVAPKTASVEFYSGDNAQTKLGEGKVTDKGEVGNYHQYELTVSKGTYSYRAVDGGTNLGGMSFEVPFSEVMADGSIKDEQKMTLVRANFYTTNSSVTKTDDYDIEILPGSMRAVVNGDKYIDSNKRVVTPTMLWAHGNAMLYNWVVTLHGDLAKSKGVAIAINNTFADTVSSAQNRTFSLADLVDYKIVAPKGAKVQMFNQIKNFNVEEVPELSHSDNEDGKTVLYTFRVVTSSNLSYRVSMDGKITRAGYMGTTEKTEPVVITFEENENPKNTENKMDLATMQSRIESSTLLNVNCQNDLALGVGETFRLRAYRGAWQIINSDTANIMIEPDFHYNVISGGEHIRMTPASNRCTGNAKDNWMDIEGVSKGIAIIEVSYDAIIIGGSGTKYSGQYGATDPNRKSIVVIDVSGNPGEIVMKAKGSENIWDTELDTVYTLSDTAALSFTATLDGAEPAVELSTDKGVTWKAVEKKDGYYVAEGLVPGNNILRFTNGTKTNYQVVRAAKVTYTVTNTNRIGNVIYAGDTVEIVFKGIYQPAPKISGIYNPGFGGKPPHAITYNVPEGIAVTLAGGQYDFISTNKITATFDKAGEFKFTDGNIHFNIMGVADPIGGHRVLTDAGVGANFSAVSTSHVRCIFPDLTFTVSEKTTICEHEWGDCIVTKAHTAAKAGEKRYTCQKCGEYKYEATTKGACAKFAEAVDEIPATCTTLGRTAGTRCSECWKVLSGMEEIPIDPSAHTFAEKWSYDDTYHWHSATCGHNVVSGKTTHSFGAWTDVSGTKSQERKCSGCGMAQTKMKEITDPEAVKDLMDKDTGNVSIEVKPSAPGETAAKAVIPAGTVKAIQSAAKKDDAVKGVDIELGEKTSVSYDAKAFEKIAETLGIGVADISLELGSVDKGDVENLDVPTKQKEVLKEALSGEGSKAELVQIELTVNGQEMSDFGGGKATVTVPYKGKATNIIVERVEADGTKTPVPSHLNEDGSVSFETGSHSFYLINEGYQITLDANGGYVTETLVVTGADGTVPTLPDAVLNRYRFVGWFSGEKEVKAGDIISANVTLKAHWEHDGNTTTVVIGKKNTKKAVVESEENPDTGAPVMNLGAVAVVLGAAYVLSKKH